MNLDYLLNSNVTKESHILLVDDFKSKHFNVDDSKNGLYFNNYYFPDEVVIQILSFVHPRDILKMGLVCKKWCTLIKSYSLWRIVYERKFQETPKNLHWFVYYYLFAKRLPTPRYTVNDLSTFDEDDDEEFQLMNAWPPDLDIPPRNLYDFSRHIGCFCKKWRIVSLTKKNLISVVLDYFKPHLSVSEWVAGKYECSSLYILRVVLEESSFSMTSLLYSQFSPPLIECFPAHAENDDGDTEWSKVIIMIENYPKNAKELVFGSKNLSSRRCFKLKMTGRVIKLKFDLVKPEEVNEELDD